MGYYVNPKDGSRKEDWLLKYGQQISEQEVKGVDLSGDRLVVCLVDNGPFTAAGIMFDDSERIAFTRDDDYRPKDFFLVSRALLAQFLPKRLGGALD